MEDDQPSNPDKPIFLDAETYVIMRTVVKVLGERRQDYAQAVRPPEHLRLSVRAMPGPVLRGTLIEVLQELSRRRRA